MCSRSVRRARPTAGGPGRHRSPRWTGWTLAAIPPAANRPRSAGSSSWTCSIRGMNGTRARRRLEDVERRPDRGVADGVDLRGDPAGRRPFDELAQPLGLGVPDATPLVGRERPVGLGLDVGEQRGRPRTERAVGEAFLPADPGTAGGIVAEDRAAPQAPLERGLERLGPERGQDADRQAAGLGEVGVGRERPAEVRIGHDPARVVDGDDAEREQLAARPSTRAVSSSADRQVRDVDGDQRRSRASSSTPSGSPVGVAPDDATGRIRACRGRSRRPRAPPGWPAARGGRAPRARSGGRARPARGRRRSASGPSGRNPSRGPPARRAGSARRGVGGADPGQAVLDASRRPRGRPGERATRGTGEVEVRVGQSGECHLVRLQRDPLGERIRPRLERDLASRRRRPVRRGSRSPRPSRSRGRRRASRSVR